MNTDDFTSNRAGKLSEEEQNGEVFHSFIPSDLPVDIEYSQETVRLIEEAAGNLNELSGIGINLPNPNIFIRPYMIKEAVLSSQIEGTQITFEEAVSDPEGKNISEREKFDRQEVHNYIKALEFGISQLEFKELTTELLKRIHRKLMSGVRGKNRSPGEFRDTYVHIGDIGASREDAEFIPVPPRKVEEKIQKLIEFIKKDSKLPYLVKTALIHYQFEAIHPFEDGNGRIGRLLIILDMVKKGYLSQPLLYLSEYFKNNISQYYYRLLNISKRGEYEEWIKFFLRAVKYQSKRSAEKAREITKKMKKYREKLREENVPDNTVKLMEKILDLKPRTIKDVQNELNVSYYTARKYLNSLEEHHIVESEKRKGRKIYYPEELIEKMGSNRRKITLH